jgi:hypothetical protein
MTILVLVPALTILVLIAMSGLITVLDIAVSMEVVASTALTVTLVIAPLLTTLVLFVKRGLTIVRQTLVKTAVLVLMV